MGEAASDGKEDNDKLAKMLQRLLPAQHVSPSHTVWE